MDCFIFSESFTTEFEHNNGDTTIILGCELMKWSTKKDKTEQNIRRKQSLVTDGSAGL